tara:strand:+ start:1338 stop:1508 length:171 start_codon:yes stop_codon:yes gene_type:complete
MDAHNSEWSRPYLVLEERPPNPRINTDNKHWILQTPTGQIIIDELHYEIEVISEGR